MVRKSLYVIVVASALGCSPSGSEPFATTADSGRVPTGDVPSVPEDRGVARDAVPIRDTGTAMITPDAACSTTTADARRLPINLLLVLDRSGSMGPDSRGVDTGKWTGAVRAVRALMERLDDSTRVGLTLFPATRSPDASGTYAAPVVPVGPLSSTRAMINDLLSRTSPGGNTPMACALQGSMQYLGTPFTMDGSRNVVLITDGAPTEECSGVTCPLFPPDFNCLLRAEDFAKDAVAIAVARGRAQASSVRTFVAGTPDADNSFLSNLAVTGNSDRAPGCRATSTCHYSLATATFERDLNAALDDIRGRALSCEFTVDADPSRVDPTRVNVNYTPGGGTSRLIPRDVTHANGWDYANGMSTVMLYGPVCEQVRGDATGRVQILFGCPTVTPG